MFQMLQHYCPFCNDSDNSITVFQPSSPVICSVSNISNKCLPISLPSGKFNTSCKPCTFFNTETSFLASFHAFISLSHKENYFVDSSHSGGFSSPVEVAKLLPNISMNNVCTLWYHVKITNNTCFL